MILARIGLVEEKQFPILSINVQSERKNSTIWTFSVGRLKTVYLNRRPLYQTLSKAFSTSKNTEAVCKSLLKLSPSSWVSLVSCKIVECSGQNANSIRMIFVLGSFCK